MENDIKRRKEDKPDIEVARACGELGRDTERLGLRVGGVREKGAAVKLGHARVVTARDADVLQGARAQQANVGLHPIDRLRPAIYI